MVKSNIRSQFGKTSCSISFQILKAWSRYLVGDTKDFLNKIMQSVILYENNINS